MVSAAPAAALAAALLLAGAAPGAAAAPDPHRLFEQRCGRCHGHAGELARTALVIDEGELRTRNSGRSARTFLERHYGRLNPDEVALLADMMTRQVQAGGLFEERCRICHDRASTFARRTLVLDDGELRGRYTGREIGGFLAHHGRLDPGAAETVYQMLRWQLESAP